MVVLLKRIKKLFLTLLSCYLVSAFSVAYGWNMRGHALVNEIAFLQLRPNAKVCVQYYTNVLGKSESDIKYFTSLGMWPDLLRAQGVNAFNRWHYINFGFSLDKTPVQDHIDTDNIIWAIATMEQTMTDKRSSAFQKALSLSFYSHLMADLHQPLHTSTMFSEEFPNGDRGGTLFQVRFNGKTMSLHSVWDGGFNSFGSLSWPIQKRSLQNLTTQAKQLLADYSPKNSDEMPQLSVESMAIESWEIAQDFAYEGLATDTLLPEPYIETGRKIANKQLVLAGLRLAENLNGLYADTLCEGGYE